jgi:hypothetical protein
VDDELKALLAPFAQAYFRMRLYHGSRIHNKRPAPLYAEMDENHFDELLASISKEDPEPALVRSTSDIKYNSERLTVGHLEALYEYLGRNNLLPEVSNV